ncbi:MAG TPA: glycosyltransferase family 9 protein [Kineosporiaceae bacterium]
MTDPTPGPRRAVARERVLVVRTDSDGDVLLAGPAVRAVARAARVTLLVSPEGQQAAGLLPGVDDVVVWPSPWNGYAPPPVDPAGTLELVARLRDRRFGAAVVLTSFHQSALPVALLLRLAGVTRISAVSVDYPGSLLDLRLPPASDPCHEVQRSLGVVAAAGYPPSPDDDGRLEVRRPLPAVGPLVRDVGRRGGFVVVHPGASVPARAPTREHAAEIASALVAAGWPVAVTGGPGERDLTRFVAAAGAAGVAGEAGAGGREPVVDLGGRTSLAELAAVLAAARCVVVGNTGPAHLAAAVGTPVVSLFAPVVDAGSWRPWRVPQVLLGDQQAPCRASRARACPVPGHPCLSEVRPADVVTAVGALAGRPLTGRRAGGAPGPRGPAR